MAILVLLPDNGGRPLRFLEPDDAAGWPRRLDLAPDAMHRELTGDFRDGAGLRRFDGVFGGGIVPRSTNQSAEWI